MAMALNYNHLRYFHLVAHEGNLTRAAERLNVSQSALSTQIRKLEDRLGHALFERRGRSLVLTEAGHIALDHADAIFTAGDELLDTLSRSGGRARRTLHVGALSTLSRNFQIRFLGPVLGDPDITVTLRSGSLADLMAQLETHALDVVLVNQVPVRGPDTEWIAHTLDEQHVSLVGAPERVGKAAEAAVLIDQHPLILPSRDSGVRSGFDAMAMRQGLTPRIAAEVDDMAMMRVLAREEIGLAVVPPIVVKDELATGRLVEAAPLPGISETFSAITPRRRFPNPVLARLLEPWGALP